MESPFQGTSPSDRGTSNVVGGRSAHETSARSSFRMSARVNPFHPSFGVGKHATVGSHELDHRLRVRAKTGPRHHRRHHGFSERFREDGAKQVEPRIRGAAHDGRPMAAEQHSRPNAQR